MNKGRKDRLAATTMLDKVGRITPNASRIAGTHNMANVGNAEKKTPNQSDL